MPKLIVPGQVQETGPVFPPGTVVRPMSPQDMIDTGMLYYLNQKLWPYAMSLGVGPDGVLSLLLIDPARAIKYTNDDLYDKALDFLNNRANQLVR